MCVGASKWYVCECKACVYVHACMAGYVCTHASIWVCLSCICMSRPHVYVCECPCGFSSIFNCVYVSVPALVHFVCRQPYGFTSDWGDVSVDGHISIRRANCVGKGECVNTCFVHGNIFCLCTFDYVYGWVGLGEVCTCMYMHKRLCAR